MSDEEFGDKPLVFEFAFLGDDLYCQLTGKAPFYSSKRKKLITIGTRKSSPRNIVGKIIMVGCDGFSVPNKKKLKTTLLVWGMKLQDDLASVTDISQLGCAPLIGNMLNSLVKEGLVLHDDDSTFKIKIFNAL